MIPINSSTVLTRSTPTWSDRLLRGFSLIVGVAALLALAAPSRAADETGGACINAMGFRCLDHQFPTTGHIAKKCDPDGGSRPCATCEAASPHDTCTLDEHGEGLSEYIKVDD